MPQTSTIPASAGPQTYALDRAATGLGIIIGMQIRYIRY
jgi:hypothetical protein